MGASEESQSNTSSMQRVKVYRLNEAGTWDDRGTGPVTFDYIERSEELGLYVIDEDVNDTLLVHCISAEDIYRKQEDIVISWRDLRRSTGMALSFQETVGCSNVWNQICTIQRNLLFNSLISKIHDLNSELRELPAATVDNLPQIHKIFTEHGIKDQMKLTKLILKDHDFFQNLMEMFKLFEDLELADIPNMISKIVKAIISFKNHQILEKVIRDELIMETIRCLGYDPCVPYYQHCQNFLKDHVIMKEALPIKDPMVLKKIYEAYNIRYLKDAVLSKKNSKTAENASGVDETLDSIISANNASIVSLLKDDSTFIQELFARLRSPSASVESKKYLVYFLHEFCSLSKSLEMMQQLQFFRDLIDEGIFDIIVEVLQSPDKELVLTGANILIPFLTRDPNLLCSYVVRSEGSPLLGLLIKGMIQDFGDKMHCQFQQIIQDLLDSNALTGGDQESAKIMDIFCEKHLPELVEVISASCPERPGNTSEGVGSDCGTKPQILLNICELLRFCIQQDSSRAKDIFLHKNASENVLLLTRRKEKYLVVAAIQFFRTILSVHDDDVQSYVVMTNMLKPIVDAFVANGNQDNLLNSTVLELLEHIRKENATVLIKYVVETFWDQLTPFKDLPSIQAFKVKYEQSLETMAPKSSADAVEPGRVDETDLNNTEENSVKEARNEDAPAPAPAPAPDPAAAPAPASASNTGKDETGCNREKEESKGHDSNVVAASSASSSPRFGGLVEYEDDASE